MKKAKAKESVEQVYIEDIMKRDYFEYSMSVIIDRSIPDIRDGLKPVQRRILWTMRNTHQYTKSARHVGEVLGKYHPHGDSSCYGSMVRMAQPWKMYVPYVDGHGNFGSIDGDQQAAMRYCLTGDALISTVDHGLISLKELAGDLELDSEKDIDITVKSAFGRLNKADKIFNSGIHDIYELQLENNMTIRGTANHPVLVLTDRANFGWVLLPDLRPGDNVVLDSSSMGDYTYNKDLLDENTNIGLLEARFLGVMISKGFTLANNKIGINYKDMSMINVVKEYLNATGNPVGNVSKCVDGFELVQEAKDIYDKLERQNFGSSQNERDIPKKMILKPVEYICEFLRYLFESNGYILTPSNILDSSVVYSAKSLKLVKHLQLILLSLRIESNTYFDKKCQEYKLTITNKMNIQRFLEKVGFVSDEKESQLKCLVSELENTKSSCDHSYSTKINQQVVQTTDLADETSFRDTESYVRNFIHIFNNIETLYKSNRCARVKRVTKLDKKEPVYSIRVCSDCHSFISNGIVSHNTEARISNDTSNIFFTENQLGMVFRDNYDGKETEPEFLTSPVPMLLVNGSSGSAVGYSTNIPSHNPKEVIKAYIQYIKGKLTNSNIRKYLKGPDHCIGCRIIDKGGIDRAYETGSGSYYCIMDYEVEQGSYGRDVIRFTNVLPNVDKVNIIEAIANNVRNGGELSGLISDLADESNMDEIAIVVTLKKGVAVKTAIEALINSKIIYSRYGITFTCIVDNRPMKLGIIDFFKYFHYYQQEISKRHLETEISIYTKKHHILEGIAHAIKNYDAVLDIIKKSKSKMEAVEKLSKKFKKLDREQINAILDIKLSSLVNKGSEILQEQKELKAKIDIDNKYINNIDDYIIENLEKVGNTLKGYTRRCQIIKEEDKK